MTKQRTMILCTIFFSLLILSVSSDSFADKDKGHGEQGEKYLAPVTNAAYKQECGACHFAYQPGLLPSDSWGKLLAQLPSHFGEEVSIDDAAVKDIGTYLTANGAEQSSSKRSRKIYRSLKGVTPTRITEAPYIIEKHRKIEANVFNLEAIGSRANCIACHTTAEQGNYDDDNVKIPR